MRTLALGDIHGCYRALQGVLEAAQVTDEDRLITLGDYVDRGPDSRAVLDWLIARAERLPRGRLVSLRGNHELMMASAREDEGMMGMWLACGGDKALMSYREQGGTGTLDDIPESHWNFIEHFCRDYFQTLKLFFVHANAYPESPLNEQPGHMLFWESFGDPPPHQSGKIMICGHTPQRTGKPRDIGHAICIDTWVYGDGWLTCLDVSTGEYWQANQRGETRSDWLDPIKGRSATSN